MPLKKIESAWCLLEQQETQAEQRTRDAFRAYRMKADEQALQGLRNALAERDRVRDALHRLVREVASQIASVTAPARLIG